MTQTEQYQIEAEVFLKVYLHNAPGLKTEPFNDVHEKLAIDRAMAAVIAMRGLL
jgi:hypothetical protein